MNNELRRFYYVPTSFLAHNLDYGIILTISKKYKNPN